MKAKILLWVVVLFVLGSLAYAVDWDSGLNLYYWLDNDTTTNLISEDYANNIDLVLHTATGNVSGKVEQSIYVGGSHFAYVPDGAETDKNMATNFTWFFWINYTDAAVNQAIFGKDNNPTRGLWIYIAANEELHYDPNAGTGNDSTLLAAGVLVPGVWQHVAIVRYANHTCETYKNGTFISATACAPMIDTAINLTIGKRPYATAEAYLTGYVDEIGIYNRSFSASDISDIWNSGNGAVPEKTISTDIDFTAIDDFNSSSINSFTVNISWPNGTSTIHSTTNGTVTVLNVSDSSLSINVTYNKTNYFNQTLLNQAITANTSNSIQASMFQAYACFNASEKVSGSYVTVDNFTIGSTNRTSCFNLSAGSRNVMASLVGWYSKNQTFNIAALSNATYTVENLSYANLTIYVKNENTNTYLSSYDITIYNSLNNSGWGGESVTGVTNYSFDLINNTFNISIVKAGYSLTNATKNVSVTGDTNYTFYLREYNSLNITVYKETENTLLTAYEVTIDIIQDNQTLNLSTVNGTLYVTDLAPGETEIRYADNNSTFEGRVYIFNLTNESYNAIRLYLLNTTISTLITFDLVDQNGQDLENAIVKAQRFYPAENLYRTVAMTRSNFNGEGTIDLVKKVDQSNVFYKFIVEYQGSTKEETNATEITANTLYFTVDILSDVFTSWDGIDNVEGSLTNGTWGDGTPYFSFVWNDVTSLVDYGCLKVTEHTPLVENVHCNSCETSTSATLICNLTDNGHLYKAVALIETNTNGSLYVVDVDSWNFDNKSETFGDYGVLISFLFVGTMAGVGLWNPVVAVVMVIISLIFSVIIGMLNLSYISIVTLVIVGAITLFRMRT